MWTQVTSDTLFGGVPLIGLSAPVLLGLAVLFIMRGNLVPRSTLEDVKKERDEWRQSHSISETARIESMRQVDTLIEKSAHTDQILQHLADYITHSNKAR